MTIQVDDNLDAIFATAKTRDEYRKRLEALIDRGDAAPDVGSALKVLDNAFDWKHDEWQPTARRAREALQRIDTEAERVTTNAIDEGLIK